MSDTPSVREPLESTEASSLTGGALPAATSGRRTVPCPRGPGRTSRRGPAERAAPRRATPPRAAANQSDKRISARPDFGGGTLPDLLTADQVATWLRTTVKAVYAKAERGTLPGATRVGRRLYFLRAELLGLVEHGRVPHLGVTGGGT